ncbi:MAG: exopolyphosphatase [Acidobacteriota bacterium]
MNDHANTAGSGAGRLDEPPEIVAAVDLGSNSFRMVIARVIGEQVQPIDRLREGVRLAGYLDRNQRLSVEGRRRALEALRRFGQRLREVPDSNLRAVGTNTLRKARNREVFLAEAKRALGHGIEVVSGQEEARLIFLGAAHSLAGGPDKRLVVDIGGGSTEVIVGRGFEPRRAESLYMGCVSWTMAHFPGGRISAKRMKRAETAAQLELRTVKSELRRLGWERCVGASGTIQAIVTILRENGWSDQGITPEGMARLREEILRCDDVEKLDLPGLRRDRARVLPGGLAILSAIFSALRIERMLVSPGAMREGLLYDLLGRMRREDARDRTIQRFVGQYRVDEEQAQRVEQTALYLLGQESVRWSIDPEIGRAFLSWGASLHEIGLAVAHAAHHKHGAYLVQHSDMPGFSYQDQQILSLLIRFHRRKLVAPLFTDALPKRQARLALRLCLLLRLACLLNRSRSSRPLPAVRLRAKGKKLRLLFPAGWLDEHPLTRADLLQEANRLAAVGYRLKIRSSSESSESEADGTAA